jgi:cytochrome bd-type quinol oxidase subunit 1
MAEAGLVTRKPRLLGVLVRVLLITFIVTLLAFAVTLLLAIIGVSVLGLVRGYHPDMANAYRYIAAPMAVLVAVIVLIAAFANEIKLYRRRLAAWRGF